MKKGTNRTIHSEIRCGPVYIPHINFCFFLIYIDLVIQCCRLHRKNLNVNVDLSKHLFDKCHTFYFLSGVVSPECKLEAILISGFFHKLFCFFKVISIRSLLLVSSDNRRNDRSCRFCISGIHKLNICVFINSVVHSLTYFFIFQLRNVHVQSYISHDVGVCCQYVYIIVSFDCFDLVCRHRINEISLACLKHSGTGTCLRNLFNSNSIYRSFFAPVIFIALESCVISLFPLCADERAGSYRMVHNIIAVLFKSSRADHTDLCHTVDKRCPWLSKLEYYSVVIRSLNAFHTVCL